MPLLNLSKVVSNCGNVSRQRKVLLESCAAVSAASDLHKASISEVPVDTDEDAVDDESSEEDDHKEFGDIPQVNDRDQEAVKFTSGVKTDCDSTETLFKRSQFKRQLLPQAFSTIPDKLQRKIKKQDFCTAQVVVLNP